MNVALAAQSAGGGSILSGLALVGFFTLLAVGGMIILALTAGRKS